MAEQNGFLILKGISRHRACRRHGDLQDILIHPPLILFLDLGQMNVLCIVHICNRGTQPYISHEIQIYKNTVILTHTQR